MRARAARGFEGEGGDIVIETQTTHGRRAGAAAGCRAAGRGRRGLAARRGRRAPGRRGLAAAALAAAWLHAAGAGAQLLPLGGKTAQMGGAATANGRDSAMPYLNPAGLAGLPKDLFALSANVYGFSRFRITPFFIKEFQYPATVEEDTQSGQSVLRLPSSVMYLTSASDERAPVRHKAGVSLIIPSATKVTLQGRYRAVQPDVFGADNDSRFFSYEYTDYNLGATYAVAFGDRLRLGGTLFGRYTASQTAEQSSRGYYSFNGAIQSDRSVTSTSTSSTSSAWAKLGAQAEIAPGLWAGAGVSTPTFLHQGSGTGATTRTSQTLGQSVNEKVTDRSDVRDRLPLSTNLGLSYERPGSFGLALDVTHARGLGGASEARGVQRINASVTGEVIRDFTRAYDVATRIRPVTNVSVGGEVWVQPWIALRVGAFTSFNNLGDPDPATDGAYYGTADTFGLTGGLGLMVGPTETSLGVSFQRSAGKITVADGSFDPAYPVALADYTINTVLFMLAGAVSVGEAREQIERHLPKGAPPLPAGLGAPAAPAAPPAPPAPNAPPAAPPAGEKAPTP
jgi:hypothetical protein